MEAKIELGLIWIFGLWAMITGKDVAVALSCIASISVIIVNYPKTIENIRKFFKK